MPITKQLLRETIDVFKYVKERFDSDEAAFDWYCSEELPGFGGSTPLSLVQSGKAQQVRDLVDAVDSGVFV